MVTFTYKSKQYEFRNPELGNADDLIFQRVNRRTRGGDLIIFRDEEWPKTETLNLVFNFDQEVDANRLLALIRLSLGDFLNYEDHESVVWLGVVQNPDTQKQQAGRNSFQINVIFEGDQV